MTRFAHRALVWTGGGLFVAALGLTAWLFLIPMGREAPFAGWAAVVADVLLFGAFAVHHSVFARSGARRILERVVPEPLVRSTYVWMASVLLAGVCLLWREVGGRVYGATGVAAVLLAAVQVVGLWFTAAGVRAIDPLELAGIRPAGEVELQTRGVYQLVRHPLYLGWMLMVFGAAHMTGDRLTFAVVTSAYLLLAIPWEERSLEQQFGERYRRYERSVRWRVIPGVY
jgi:protein-S-isoprenylcysteine O-methyltransferase Ste14